MQFIVTVSFHDADANDVAVMVEAADLTSAEDRAWEYFMEDGVAEVAGVPASPADEEKYQGLAI
jgi:hypothetical protein